MLLTDAGVPTSLRPLAASEKTSGAAIPERRRRCAPLKRDGQALGLGGPSIVLLTDLVKPFRTTFSSADYKRIRTLGEEYRARKPRSVLK